MLTAWPRRPTYSGRGASAPSPLRQHLIGNARPGNHGSAALQGPSIGGPSRIKIGDGILANGGVVAPSLLTSGIAADQKTPPVPLRPRSAVATPSHGYNQKVAAVKRSGGTSGTPGVNAHNIENGNADPPQVQLLRDLASGARLPEARARTPGAAPTTPGNSIVTNAAVVRSSRGVQHRRASENSTLGSGLAPDQRPVTPGVSQSSARGQRSSGAKPSRCWSSHAGTNNHSAHDTADIPHSASPQLVPNPAPVSPVPLAVLPSAVNSSLDDELTGDDMRRRGTLNSSRVKGRGAGIPRPHSAQAGASSSLPRTTLPPAGETGENSPQGENSSSMFRACSPLSVAEEDEEDVISRGIGTEQERSMIDSVKKGRNSPSFSTTPLQLTVAGTGASAARMGHPNLQRASGSRSMSPSVPAEIEAQQPATVASLSVAIVEAKNKRGGGTGVESVQGDSVSIVDVKRDIHDGAEGAVPPERNTRNDNVPLSSIPKSSVSPVGTRENFSDWHSVREQGPTSQNSDAQTLSGNKSSSKPPQAPTKRCRSADNASRRDVRICESSIRSNNMSGSPADGINAKSSARIVEDPHKKSHSRTCHSEEVYALESTDEPECILIGTEDLPLIGAAGVLVLPRKLGANVSRQVVEDPFGLGTDDLDGWSMECHREELAPDRLLDAARRTKRFSAYISSLANASTADKSEEESPPMEELTALAAEAPAPIHGPGLLQLASDPARREECPVCNAEWKSALRQLGAATTGSGAIKASDGTSNSTANRVRRAVMGRAKMHSIRCTWSWFQQNLCTSLCQLRFDAEENARPVPIPPNRFLPPPMMDVWSFWKQKGSQRDRDFKAERLLKGEPT